MSAKDDPRWKLAADIAAEVDKVRDRPDLFPWPRNFVDYYVMPLVDAYVAERLAGQREAIADDLDDETFIEGRHDAARVVREYGKTKEAS